MLIINNMQQQQEEEQEVESESEPELGTSYAIFRYAAEK